MKSKGIRIYWRDWKILRGIVRGERNETIAEYMSRIVSELKKRYKNA